MIHEVDNFRMFDYHNMMGIPWTTNIEFLLGKQLYWRDVCLSLVSSKQTNTDTSNRQSNNSIFNYKLTKYYS